MKKLLFILCALACTLVCVRAESRLTAFPGAEGFGKFTTGGRGGVVYHVTRLDDCTDANLVEGTLRWALRTGDATPRTIVFDTCGTIVLDTKLKLQYPNVTIAGQSAPGGGICIAGACIYVCQPNVIIRYIRFRSGDVVDGNYQCLDVENTRNVIIDHCSLTWAVEECLTMYDCDSTTVQWCILGEGLYDAGHKKGQRSYATQWGGEHSSMHHTLITNCYNRTPRFNGVRDEANLKDGKHDHDAQVVSEFSNNVVANWGKTNSVYGGELITSKNLDEHGRLLGYDHIYMRNNYYRPGPLTNLKIKSASSLRFVVPSDNNGSWYLDGNRMADSTLAINTNNYTGWSTGQKLDTAYTCLTQLQSAKDAYAAVVAGAGASLPRYDEVDTRLLAEVAGTIEPQYVGSTEPTWIGIINSQKDITFQHPDTFMHAGELVTSYPYIGLLEGDTLLVDTDRDGMPDAWELANGLDPADPEDRNLTIVSSAGYTALECYLNGGNGELADAIPDAPEIPIVPEWTALINNPINSPAAHVVWANGVLLVEKNGEKYTLSGQKLQ